MWENNENEPEQAVRRAVAEARIKYIKPPLIALLLLLALPLLSAIAYGFGPYLTYMPDIVFIAAIVVIFFGAWYDFGANAYLKDLKDLYHKTPTDADMAYIQKQQFILTVLYILIGLIYIASAVVIYLI